MSEIKPTMENLMDPYVLQLIEALGRRDDEIERLEAERLAFATESEMRQAALKEKSDGRTHWEGCYTERGHHECAIAQVKRLTAERDNLQEIANKYEDRYFLVQAMYNEASEEVTTYSLLLDEAQARVEELEAALKGEMVACLCGDPLCPDGPRHRTGEGDE